MEEKSQERKIIEYYEERLKNKPSGIQIFSLCLSCFALGVSLSKLFL